MGAMYLGASSGVKIGRLAPRMTRDTMHVMKPDKPLFDARDAAAEAEADARAEADVRAGRTIGHDAVKRWIASWGSDTPLPRPRVGD
jgi:predicted transcriptional regulator